MVCGADKSVCTALYTIGWAYAIGIALAIIVSVVVVNAILVSEGDFVWIRSVVQHPVASSTQQ